MDAVHDRFGAAAVAPAIMLRRERKRVDEAIDSQLWRPLARGGIGAVIEQQRFVRTVRGVGYRMGAGQ